jgi:uncharacterized membrane protein YjjB (DUF3815 family)
MTPSLVWYTVFVICVNVLLISDSPASPISACIATSYLAAVLLNKLCHAFHATAFPWFLSSRLAGLFGPGH